MSYEALRFWLEVVQFLVTIFIGVFAWWRTREKVASSHFSALERRIGDVETKVGKVETAVKNMPICSNHDRMEKNDEKLFRRFDQLHGDIRELVGGVKSLSKALDMVQEHLINGGK